MSCNKIIWQQKPLSVDQLKTRFQSDISAVKQLNNFYWNEDNKMKHFAEKWKNIFDSETQLRSL